MNGTAIQRRIVLKMVNILVSYVTNNHPDVVPLYEVFVENFGIFLLIIRKKVLLFFGLIYDTHICIYIVFISDVQLYVMTTVCFLRSPIFIMVGRQIEASEHSTRV